MTIWSLNAGAVFWLQFVIKDGIDAEVSTIHDFSEWKPISSVFEHHILCTNGMRPLNDLEIHIDNARNE